MQDIAVKNLCAAKTQWEKSCYSGKRYNACLSPKTKNFLVVALVVLVALIVLIALVVLVAVVALVLDLLDRRALSSVELISGG